MSSSEESRGASESDVGSANDEQREAELAAKLLGDDQADDPNDDRVEMDCEPRPNAGGGSGAGAEEGQWGQRSAVERLSAAGQAPHARDRLVGGADTGEGGGGGGRPSGVMFNPKDYPLTQQETNVDRGELPRLERLRDQWYGVAHVGDGADAVAREDLDAWQKFAHDVVMDPRHKAFGALAIDGDGVGWYISTFVERNKMSFSIFVGLDVPLSLKQGTSAPHGRTVSPAHTAP